MVYYLLKQIPVWYCTYSMCLFRNRGFTSIYGTFLAKMMMSPAGFWGCSAMIGETQVEYIQICGLPWFTTISFNGYLWLFCLLNYRVLCDPISRSASWELLGRDQRKTKVVERGLCLPLIAGFPWPFPFDPYPNLLMAQFSWVSFITYI